MKEKNQFALMCELVDAIDPDASIGVLDPCGSRQMDMQACPLGSLLAGIKDYGKLQGRLSALQLFRGQKPAVYGHFRIAVLFKL